MLDISSCGLMREWRSKVRAEDKKDSLQSEPFVSVLLSVTFLLSWRHLVVWITHGSSTLSNQTFGVGRPVMNEYRTNIFDCSCSRQLHHCSAQLLVVTVQRAILNQENPTLLRVTSLLW